jgi:hypothetical protein
MGVDREAALVRKFVELAKLMNVYLNHFPRHERYALSSQIRNTAYGVYGLIVECWPSRRRARSEVSVLVSGRPTKMSSAGGW